MMKKLTIDSSVIIASLLENESRHGEAMRIWDAVIAGGDVAIMPYSVFVEGVAAIRRRTGSEELANEVKEELLKIENVSLCHSGSKGGRRCRRYRHSKRRSGHGRTGDADGQGI